MLIIINHLQLLGTPGRPSAKGQLVPMFNGDWSGSILPETNVAPENWWLEYGRFLLWWTIFRCELLVSGRVSAVLICLGMDLTKMYWSKPDPSSETLPSGRRISRIFGELVVEPTRGVVDQSWSNLPVASCCFCSAISFTNFCLARKERHNVCTFVAASDSLASA